MDSCGFIVMMEVLEISDAGCLMGRQTKLDFQMPIAAVRPPNVKNCQLWAATTFLNVRDGAMSAHAAIKSPFVSYDRLLCQTPIIAANASS
jgi:hypothetical protein